MSSHRLTRARLLPASAVALLLGLAACGGDGDSPEEASGATGPAGPEGSAGEEVPEGEAGEDPEEAEEEQAAELPGGGDVVFPDRRMVALYGSPDIPELGILGEGSLEDAVDHVQDYAEQYEQFSEEPVIPAFEIITTVASTEPGPDGDYTNEIDPEVIEPWVEAAAEEDIYVVLDLQPGHKHFQEQAEIYEDLLREPHVGLALDPEWRLDEGQRHLEQVGSVSAQEINETAEWLAEITADEGLPQKVFMVHQFKDAMIQDREDIDTSHEELAMVLHSDGHGTPELKLEVYEALQQDLPEDIWMAWKNFYDEDSPTFSPEETYDVDPQPWFVSYQ